MVEANEGQGFSRKGMYSGPGPRWNRPYVVSGPPSLPPQGPASRQTYRHPPWLDGCHSTHRGMSDRCHTRLLLPKAYIVDQLRPAYLLSLHEDSLRTYLTASYVLSMCLSCQPRLSSYTPQLFSYTPHVCPLLFCPLLHTFEKRANVWLVGGGTFGRRAASGFAGGRKKSCDSTTP